MNLREWLLDQERTFVPEKPRKGLDSAKMEQLHNDIATGAIDVGPKPDHSKPIKDIRYKGPSAIELGLEILSNQNGHSVSTSVDLKLPKFGRNDRRRN